MRQIIFLLIVSIFLISCAQNDTKQKEAALKQNDSPSNKTAATNPAVTPAPDTNIHSVQENKKLPSDTKILTLVNPGFYFGDIGHLTFKDFTTHKEAEYEWIGEIPAIDEIIKKCQDHQGCPALKGQVYTATLQFKLMDIEDWNGEEMKPTGKKEKRWVIIALQKTSKS